MDCGRSSRDFYSSAVDKEVVGAIVVNTNDVCFYAFRTNSTHVVSSHRVPVSNVATSREGWAEQDPMTLLKAVQECVYQTVTAGQVMGVPVTAVGIANHPGSVVAWNRRTGTTLCNLILSSDNRTAAMVERYSWTCGKYRFQKTCGLPFSTYFAAFTIKWLIDNDVSVNEAYKNGNCYFGTVDTWLLWNLTGGVKSNIYFLFQYSFVVRENYDKLESVP